MTTPNKPPRISPPRIMPEKPVRENDDIDWLGIFVIAAILIFIGVIW